MSYFPGSGDLAGTTDDYDFDGHAKNRVSKDRMSGRFFFFFVNI